MKYLFIILILIFLGCSSNRNSTKSVTVFLTSSLSTSDRLRNVKIYLDEKKIFEKSIEDSYIPTDIDKRLICFDVDSKANGILTLSIDLKQVTIDLKKYEANCINIVMMYDELTIMLMKYRKADSISLVYKKSFDSKKIMDSLKTINTNHKFDTIKYHVEVGNCLSNSN